jgi:hypothetical protein
MANGSIGCGFYVDSAGLNIDLSMDVQSILLIATNTTSVLELALKTNTAQIVFRQTSPDNNPVSISTYLGGVEFEKLYVKTLVAGTAILYYR